MNVPNEHATIKQLNRVVGKMKINAEIGHMYAGKKEEEISKKKVLGARD